MKWWKRRKKPDVATLAVPAVGQGMYQVTVKGSGGTEEVIMTSETWDGFRAWCDDATQPPFIAIETENDSLRLHRNEIFSVRGRRI